MALMFDSEHQPIVLKDRAYLRIVRKAKKGYTLPDSSAISPIRVGPFKILSQVNPLAYELELPRGLAKIHPIISIAHLEKCLDDLHGRPIPEPPTVIFDDQEHFKIDLIVQKRFNEHHEQEHFVRFCGHPGKKRFRSISSWTMHPPWSRNLRRRNEVAGVIVKKR